MSAKKVSKKNKKKVKKELNGNNRDQFMVMYDQEIKLSNVNFEKVDTKWNKIRQELNNNEIKEDLKVMRTAFESYLYSKLTMLNHLLKEFEDNAECRQHLVFAHCMGLDRLKNIMKQRLEPLRKHFQSQVEVEEARNISTVENAMIAYLKDVTRFQEERNEEDEKEIQSRKREMLREARFEHAALMDNLQEKIEEQMEDLLTKMQTILSFKISAEYEYLKLKDDWYADIVRKQFSKIKSLNNRIHILKCRLNSTSPATGISVEDELDSEIREKRLAKRLFFAKILKTKENIRNEIKEDKLKILKLTTESDRVCQFLLIQLNKREQILRLKQLSLQYESPSENCVVKTNMYRCMTDQFGVNKLTRFWEHFGQVESSYINLKENFKLLQKENKILRRSLVNFFKCLKNESKSIDG